MIGIAKAIGETLLGLLGVALANSVDDSFGGLVLVYGIVYAFASWLLLRGNKIGYWVTIVLSTVGLIVAIVYAFQAESSVLGAALVAGTLNALVLYLLLFRQSAREFFSRA
jgi:hypothetical protein